ncbi:hypothetical protein F4679DRAFT_486378 [Xylaria curta]|nr:hypothetical protein F4679DRAFT_486378 [Xylaria curta]
MPLTPPTRPFLFSSFCSLCLTYPFSTSALQQFSHLIMLDPASWPGVEILYLASATPVDEVATLTPLPPLNLSRLSQLPIISGAGVAADRALFAPPLSYSSSPLACSSLSLCLSLCLSYLTEP